MTVATNSSDSSCIEAEIKKKTVLEKVFYFNLQLRKLFSYCEIWQN